MRLNYHLETDQALEAAAARYEFVLVPGLQDSGPEHWQTCWQNHQPFWHRVTQRNWNTPDIDLWINSITRLLLRCPRPAILVGHSFGALASCCVAVDLPELVAGLMLVAPAEPMKFELEDRIPNQNLGVPSILVASQNDPLMRFSRASEWAATWHSHLIDIGEAGHINAESGFGPWRYGLDALHTLVQKIDAANTSTSVVPSQVPAPEKPLAH
ncbi:MAG: alpha/beta hydrolase [Formivibrio sp.]|nr:alpha/beta hydrolase [Formivibrio sp.]